jgi:CRISPR system Cascade subunit CasA
MAIQASRSFNLVREPWIPIAGRDRVSLAELFASTSLPALGGNAIEKISLLKLALAVAQTAATPEDDAEWAKSGFRGIGERSCSYLEDHVDDFWLRSDRPFLQVPAIAEAEQISLGAAQPMIAAGNSTIFFESQIERDYSDPEIAVLLVTLMNFALGGKKTDNTVVLSKGYMGKTKENGKPRTGTSGPSLGFLGYLHNFLLGRSVLETVWLNLLTKTDIEGMAFFGKGLGRPIWERMPGGEDDEIARISRDSYLGRLLPLSRFVLLAGEGLHYSGGITYPSHKEGAQDVSIAVTSDSDRKALWTDPDKRPWRQLPSLLAFFKSQSENDFDCRLLRVAIPRAAKAGAPFRIWSGGLRVSSNAGEQYVSGRDDFLESEIELDPNWLGEAWFQRLKLEMDALEDQGKGLFRSVLAYGAALKADTAGHAAKATEGFWSDCESIFQELVTSCGDGEGARREALRKRIARIAEAKYDETCPRDSARQFEAWAEHRISTSRYTALP